MEELEKARDRDRRRYKADILEAVVANTIDDIKYIVRQFDPVINKQSENIDVTAGMSIQKDGKDVAYKVSVPSRSKTKREILIEGIDLIKRMQNARIESQKQEDQILTINGKTVKPATFRPAEESSSWVDPLIKQWTGGYRHGTKIRWNIPEGTIQYDPYEHKLTRILDEG